MTKTTQPIRSQGTGTGNGGPKTDRSVEPGSGTSKQDRGQDGASSPSSGRG